MANLNLDHKIDIPFARDGDKINIPDTSGSGYVNMTTGLGVKYETPTDDGGEFFDREIINTALYTVYAAVKELQDIAATAGFPIDMTKAVNVLSLSNGGTNASNLKGAQTNLHIFDYTRNNYPTLDLNDAMDGVIVCRVNYLANYPSSLIASGEVIVKTILAPTSTKFGQTDAYSYNLQYFISRSNNSVAFRRCTPNSNVGQWVLLVNSEGITNNYIANNAITGTKIANNSVSTSKLVDFAVTKEKLAPNSVDQTKILAGSVVASSLAANAVTQVKILDKNVTTSKIADLAVTTNKLASGSVNSDKILNYNVTTLKIANGNVTNEKLADGAVTDSKANFTDVIARSIEFRKAGSSSNNGGYIDFHFNSSTADYTSRIIESQSGRLDMWASKGVYVNGQEISTNKPEVIVTDSVTWIKTPLSNGKYLVYGWGVKDPNHPDGSPILISAGMKAYKMVPPMNLYLNSVVIEANNVSDNEYIPYFPITYGPFNSQGNYSNIVVYKGVNDNGSGISQVTGGLILLTLKAYSL